MNVIRHRLRRAAIAVIGVIAVVTFTACGGSSAAARPSTTARLQILFPTPQAVTGTDVMLQTALIGAHVVPAGQVSGPLHGDEGHIHVSLDGKLVSMAFGLTQNLPGLTPGPHALQAEFVATDHQPFANRVVAAVLFQVRP